MEHLAILGLGLMGASAGFALRKRGFEGRITGYARRAETLNRAGQAGLIEEGSDDPAQAVEGADVVLLCVPVAAMAGLLEQTLPGLKSGALVTDVGSTKAGLVRDLDALMESSPAVFVGSHPIAGSEQQGLEAASADLYEGAVVVVTPGEATPSEAIDRTCTFWRDLGSRVMTMLPDEHDCLLGRTSHVPHVAASALSLAVGAAAESSAPGVLCGSGFEDTTRIAEGSPCVWRDILLSNREHVLAALGDLEHEIAGLRTLLESADADAVESWLHRAGEARRQLLRERLNFQGDA